MSKNRFYYYDHNSCTFVEVRAGKGKLYARAVSLAAAVVVMAALVSWGMDEVVGTPQELALMAENQALQQELATVDQRVEQFRAQLEQLSERDRTLYRTLLDAEPISEDVRQVGVGGSDGYDRFARFGVASSMLLRRSSQTLDQLERQLNLQSVSYRELRGLAEDREVWLSQMPAIVPVGGKIVSGFGMRRHPILRVRKMHAGVDVLVPSGTAVFASADGVVAEAGWGSGYGYHVRLRHNETGYSTLYAHLSEIPKHIQRGRKVERGEQIGLSGNTGRSTAPHLHYEVRDKTDTPLNPVYFMMPSLTPEQYQAMLLEAQSNTAALD